MRICEVRTRGFKIAVPTGTARSPLLASTILLCIYFLVNAQHGPDIAPHPKIDSQHTENPFSSEVSLRTWHRLSPRAKEQPKFSSEPRYRGSVDN